MKIQEIQAKTIITPSKLPDADFVINPYIGCAHGCTYCYANFMKKFTWHMQDQWGDFVDIKINWADLIKWVKSLSSPKPACPVGRSIKSPTWWPDDLQTLQTKLVIWSVTDPYQSIESKYQLTRNILKKLIGLDAHIDIITKSGLITRDIDILKQMKHVRVTTSMCASEEKVKSLFEKNSPTLKERKKSLNTLHENGIITTLFISPLLPEVTDRKKIILETKDYIDEYWFENLNLYASIKKDMFAIVEKIEPSLLVKYKEIYEKGTYEEYRSQVESDIQQFCLENNIKYKIYFHHKKNKK